MDSVAVWSIVYEIIMKTSVYFTVGYVPRVIRGGSYCDKFGWLRACAKDGPSNYHVARSQSFRICMAKEKEQRKK